MLRPKADAHSFVAQALQESYIPYFEAFQATGCPNDWADMTSITSRVNYWMSVSDDRAFSDMYAYCDKTRNGKFYGKSGGITCCGGDGKCKPPSCSKQIAFGAGKKRAMQVNMRLPEL